MHKTKNHKDPQMHPLFLYKKTFLTFFTPLLFLPLIVINGEEDIESPEGDVYDSAKVARFGYSLIGKA